MYSYDSVSVIVAIFSNNQHYFVCETFLHEGECNQQICVSANNTHSHTLVNHIF